MKTKIYLLMLSALLTTNLVAQEKLKGNKNVITQHREVANFTGILIKDNLKIFITESPVSKVSVETDENLQSAIATRVSNDVLEVYLSQPIARKKKLNIYIGVTDSIQRIEARDNANIIGENEIHTNDIELIAHDNSRIKMNFRATNFTVTAQDRADLNCNVSASDAMIVTLENNTSFITQATCATLSASLSDSSSLKPAGNCQEINVISNDNGSFKGKDMLTDYATVQVTDRADVYINVSKEIIINSENNASIHLYDNPKISMEKFVDKSTLHKK